MVRPGEANTQRRFGADPGTISSGLLCSVRQNEEEAWQRTAMLYAPLVYHWCRRAGLQHSDSDDVLQEVFRTVAMKIRGFIRDKDSGSFRSWLRTITRNKVGDCIRARRKERELHQHLAECQSGHRFGRDAQADAFEEDVSVETRILYARVLDLIQGDFEQHTWQAFVRVVRDGAPPQSVAEELGIALHSVYSAKSRVLRRVRDTLADVLV